MKLEKDQCNKTFKSKDYLKTHMKRIHLHKKKFYKCDQCDKSLSSIFSLEKHIHSHRNIRHFNCEVCDKSFLNKHYLDVHLKIVHERSQILECRKCISLQS